MKDELELIWNELEPYANPPREAIPALKVELKSIIRMLVELGILFCRVTEWKLQPMAPYSVKVGEKFNENYMELMDKASEEIYEMTPEAPVTCVLNAPWRRATFPQVGETMEDEDIYAIVKAQVSLVNYGLSLDPKDGDLMPPPTNSGLNAWDSIVTPLPPLLQSAYVSRTQWSQPSQKSEPITAPNDQEERGSTARHKASQPEPMGTQRKPEPHGLGAEWQVEHEQLVYQLEVLQQDYNELINAKNLYHRQAEKERLQSMERAMLAETELARLGHLREIELHLWFQLKDGELPEEAHPEDIYKPFDLLFGATQQWAITFAIEQPKCTLETLEALQLSDHVVSCLKESFLDLEGLTNLELHGGFWVKCIIAVLLQAFLAGPYLTGCKIGFGHDLYVKCQDIMRTFRGFSGEQAFFYPGQN